MHAARLRFHEYELDRDEFELRREGRRVPIERKPLELLIFLVERPGQLTRREEIVERVWGKDLYFDAENGVNNAIRKIRTALRDNADSPRFIETTVGKGYRFIAPVEGDAPLAVPPAPPAAKVINGPRLLWRRIAFAAACLLVITVLGITVGMAHRRNATARAPQIHSLAVLPLNNLSGDPEQEYFVDGMTDALITDLAQIADLRVISRTSSMQYKGTHQSLRDVTRALGVDAVIEGSAVRAGDKIRITAQLIYAPTDEHLWAENFEGNGADVIAVQDEVARAIAERVQGRLGAGHAAPVRRPVNSQAYEAYLRGRYFFDKRTPADAQKSVAYFRQAIHADPQFAPAYAGLAEALPPSSWFAGQAPLDVMPEAKAAASKALELDDSLGEAHTALGSLLSLYDWDWPAAERELKRGLQLSPSSSLAHERYAMWLQSMGRVSEAVEESRRAQALDPLSFFMNRELGRSLYLARRYNEALESLTKSAEMQPDTETVWNFVANIYEKQGRRTDAVRLMTEGKVDRQLTPAQLALLQRAYLDGGWTAYWERWLALHASKQAAQQYTYELAQSEARLGHAAKAWEWMERDADRRDVWATWIAVDPIFDDLRTDPAYTRLLQRVHLGR